jgi:hypothetical protein
MKKLSGDTEIRFTGDARVTLFSSDRSSSDHRQIVASVDPTNKKINFDLLLKWNKKFGGKGILMY